MKLLKVTSVRYFETNRGLGYQAKTNVPTVEILNDGQGGCTYLEGSATDIAPYKQLDWDNEDLLEELIDNYED